MKTTNLVAAALLLAAGAHAQSIPSALPRVFDAADNPSPTSTIGWYWFKLSSPDDLLPASNGLPTTANLVHLTYGDTDNFVPQIEYRCSTNGGLNFGAPIALHTLVSGERIEDEFPQLVSQGHNVFFVFRSNLADTQATTANFPVYAYGSNDAGKTWQGPLLLTPAYVGANATLKHNLSPSGAKYDAAAADGRLHVVHEALQTVTGAPNLEEIYYSSAEFDANGKFVTRKTDVRITEYAQPNEFDVDHPHIDASGANVGIVWYDDRLGQGNTANWTLARISNDGGDTWGKEVDVNQATLDPNNAPTVPSVDEPDIAISGKNIYICYEDSRNGSGDSLFLMFSNDSGATWTRVDAQNNRIRLNVQVASDVDQFDIDAHGDTLLVTWFEDLGLGNAANLAYAYVDTKAGADTVAGIATPFDLSAISNHGGDINIAEQCDCKGRFMSASFEGSSGESAVMAWTCDAGKTWTMKQVSDGSRDVDEPYCESTLAGDHNLVYLEDFTGGNNGNATVVTGIRTPTLENDTSATMGVKMTCGTGSAGALAIAVFSDKVATKTSPGIVLNSTGIAIGIQSGIVFSVGLDVLINNPTIYSGTVDANGELTLPNIPNFKALLGLDIYCALVTLHGNAQPAEFTDPVKLR